MMMMMVMVVVMVVVGNGGTRTAQIRILITRITAHEPALHFPFRIEIDVMMAGVTGATTAARTEAAAPVPGRVMVVTIGLTHPFAPTVLPVGHVTLSNVVTPSATTVELREGGGGRGGGD